MGGGVGVVVIGGYCSADITTCFESSKFFFFPKSFSVLTIDADGEMRAKCVVFLLFQDDASKRCCGVFLRWW